MPDRPLSKADARLGALLVVVFAIAYGVIARCAFHGFPFSGDEYSGLLQADIFARGALRVPAPAHASLFAVDHVVIDEWVRSKYAPGCSALLAMGVLARAPWIVSPLEAAATLALLGYAARVTFGDRAALVTVLVAGTCPLFVFHASSFYSHAAVTLFLAGALAAVARHAIDPRRRWLLVAGAAIGCAFLTRPLEALVFAAALLALRDVRAIALVALAAIPVAALTFAYQKAQFGSLFVDGYRAYEPAALALYGRDEAQRSVALGHVVDIELQAHHLELVRSFFVDWAIPGALAVAVIGVRAAPPASARVRDVLVALAVLTVVSLVPLYTAHDDGALPRYLSSLVIPTAMLAGPGWLAIEAALSSHVPRAWSSGAGLALVALGGLSFASFLDTRLPALWTREGLFREVEARGLHDAVVVVRAKFPSRYTRNGATFDGSVLYVMPDVATDAQLATWFPGRALYEATEGRPWSIRALGPAS